jgi:CPA1 family monovalent cation:H+ antiporter
VDSITLLTAILGTLVAIAFLYAVAQRVGVPYPALFVLGGLALGLVPGLPRVALEPDLVLLVFLPPLLFIAATETPTRELRANIAPIARLAFVLVLVTMVAVAVVANTLVPTLGWAAALTLGAIVAPTDAIAATSVFRRLGVPRIVTTLVEGEALFNDATALVAYRVGVIAVASGAFVLQNAAASFGIAAVGGIAVGLIIGWVAVEVFRRLDEPAVEVVLSMVVPFAAYLPADLAGLSGVLAAVTTGLVIGRRLGTILSARTRVLWLSTWKMIGFVLNGFVFVLIGLQLPDILQGLAGRDPLVVGAHIVAICVVVLAARFAYVYGATKVFRSSPAMILARTNVALAKRVTFLVAWSGMRGAVSLAAALALPPDFPERNLILLATFAVILVTLVGQGMTLPLLVRRDGWSGAGVDADEGSAARAAAYEAGLQEVERQRAIWAGHQPLFDRLESGLRDRTQHLATEDETETSERRQERVEHEQIQLAIIRAQRSAVIDLRDRGEINDETLREVERELDLEELRMEG